MLCGCSTERTGGSTEEGVPPPACVSQTQRAEPMGAVEARALWDSCQIANYDITMSYRPSGFLEPARVVLVKVRKGAKLSVEVPDRNDQRGNLGFYAPYHTVEGIFARIETLRQGSSGITIMSVKYNDLYGYPEEIRYSEPIPDGGFTFHVLDLRPVGADGT